MKELLQQPPTDSFYKYITVIGFGLMAVSFYCLLQARTDLSAAYIKHSVLLQQKNEEMRGLPDADEYIKANHLDANKKLSRPDATVIDEKYKLGLNETNQFLLLAKSNVSILEFSCTAGCIVGVVLFSSGIVLWYSRIQRKLDSILHLEVEIKKCELRAKKKRYH